MSIITIILATIVALEHFYIFYLESIATQSDATSRVFNMDKEELARPSVRKIKGFIMLCRSLSLVWDLFLTEFRNCDYFCFICDWCCGLWLSHSR